MTKEYLVGLQEPGGKVGYITVYTQAGSFAVADDINLARKFANLEDAKRYCTHINNVASFDDNFNLRYDVFEYVTEIKKLETDISNL